MDTRLPELDLSAFHTAPDSDARRAFVRRLREACHGPGFCYLSGHGVPAELDARIMAAAHAFFALPAADKEALAITRSPHFRGYTPLGGERTRGIRDWREQLDVGAEEAVGQVRAGDPPWTRLRGPNQWPARLPELRPAVLDWMRAMDRAALAVMRAIALGLGQPHGHFDSVLLPRGDPHLKIVRYPSLPDAADDPSVAPARAVEPARDVAGQGVGLHHDSGLLSFVLQDEVGGLQVQIGDRVVDVEPRAGTYVMNLGEMLQAATNGYLRATPHRVQSPPPGRERLSIAYFYHPRLEAVFAPIALPAELAAEARGSQNTDIDDPVLSTFGDNYLKIRLRSHPDVAAAHYADIAGGIAGRRG